MSQVSIIDITGGHPEIPTEFITDSGTAIPIANQLEILGDISPPGTTPHFTTGSGNTVTSFVQISQAIAATNVSNIGLSAFNSAEFSVDGNGFVSLIGGGAVNSFTTDIGGPVSPNGSGQVAIVGTLVSASGFPIRTDGTVASVVNIELQKSSAQIGSTNSANGLSHFNSAQFTVDGNGFVSALGTAIGQTITGQTGGALSPVAGNWNIFGAVVAAGTSPVATSGAGNTLTTNVQISQALAAADATKIGLSNFDSARFTVSATGFVSASGTGLGQTITGQSGGALSPTAGNWNIFGGTVVAGTSPVTTSGAGSTLTTNVQISQALAAGDATKIGLSNFDSSDFTVSAAGFVQLAGGGAGQTITGDTGGALAPTAGNWNILGRSGSKTAGSGSTLTVNSPPFADQGGSTSVTLNTGSFATAAITLTTPVTAGLLDGDLLQFVATNGVLVVQLAATQVAHIGTLSTSVAGTMTGTNTGDSLSLRYQASTNDWWATSVIGTWVMA